MLQIRVVFLWHMHQPYYKDLVTGQYRLPWVRMHALKDYYGMVKLLDEFPAVHQTFNLVPSLMLQIEDYVSGAARDPFYDVVAKPASELNPDERAFALQYLFQANVTNMIERYPRYAEVYRQRESAGADPAKAEKYFSTQDFADLQVLSQIAWFDEFFLDAPQIAELIAKGRNFTLADQQAMLEAERRILASVLPAYASAADRGGIEISTSPFYHPILPLLCDTNMGRVSSPGLPLPKHDFRHPEDAAEQLQLGLALHEKVFRRRPAGVWPSEGSVSNEVLTLAARQGIQWMATDEGVLGRSLNFSVERDGQGMLVGDGPNRLYTIYRYENDEAPIHLIFRDHSLSDLIGFVYSGMKPKDAAQHFLNQIRESARPVLAQGRDAVVPVILDGENAWEYYPQSGREFLRCLYDVFQEGKEFVAVTVSEAIARHENFGRLSSVTPGSWIDANFNVWIGAPEDNLSWDCLSAARDFYTAHADKVPEEQRRLAFEELLIAEGSDWNWWYGPEHHSANDADFDDLYRKHLSNVYQALGAIPPESLAQPIAQRGEQAEFTPQTAYIHPRMSAAGLSYFDWMGAAAYFATRSGSAMHGKQFLLEAAYTGIDETWLYGRLDFIGGVPAGAWMVAVNFEIRAAGTENKRPVRIAIEFENGAVQSIRIRQGSQPSVPALDGNVSSMDHNRDQARAEVFVVLTNVFQFKVALARLGVAIGDRVSVRFTLLRDRLPVDAIPSEGAIMLEIGTEDQLGEMAIGGW